MVRNKKAAMELSMSTIVILVLAMSMLILGLVLVRTIFTGAKYNVEQINEKTTTEINKLFTEEAKVVLYLPNRLAEIAPGKPFGVAFGIQNIGQTGKFSWDVEVADEKVKEKCGVSKEQAIDWISTGKTDTIDLASGDKHADVITFNIPTGQITDLSKCIVRYKLIIKQDGNPYQTEAFNLQTV